MEWKPIPGYDGYLVSDTGLVFSEKSHKELKLWKDHSGYLIADLYKDEGRYHCRVHRLVLLAFVGEPPEDKNDVNHKDGDRTNNNLGNLEYCSRSENLLHKYRTLKRKSNNGNRDFPLTDNEIAQIRAMHQSKQYSLKQIREYWNISQGGLCDIIYYCGCYKNR